MILRIIFFTLLSIGLTFIALDIFKIPYLKTSRAVKNLLKKRSKNGGYSGICRSVRLYFPAFVSRLFNSVSCYIYGREPKAIQKA